MSLILPRAKRPSGVSKRARSVAEGMSSFLSSFFKSRAGFFSVVLLGAVSFAVSGYLSVVLLCAYVGGGDPRIFLDGMPVLGATLSGSFAISAFEMFGFLVSAVLFIVGSFCVYVCLGDGREQFGMDTEVFSFADEALEARKRARAVIASYRSYWLYDIAEKVFSYVPHGEKDSDVARILSEKLGMGIVSFDVGKYKTSLKDLEDERVVAWLEDAMEADMEVANAIADIWAAALHGHKLEYNVQASYLELGRDLGVDLSLEAYRNGVPAEHVIGSV